MNTFGLVDSEVELPLECLTNEEMAGMVKCPADELLSYTGVKLKPVYRSQDDVFELGFKAAQRLLSRHPKLKDKIRLVVTGTTHSDSKICWYPAAVACKRLDLDQAFGIDLQHGCNSTLAAMEFARLWLKSKESYALIIVADRISTTADMTNPSHKCIFNFSDGGSAVLVGFQNIRLEYVSANFTTCADLAESQHINRKNDTFWFNESEEEDKLLIETYRREYSKNIELVSKGMDAFDLVMNQGDHKLILYLQDKFQGRLNKAVRTHETLGHVGNSDVIIGLNQLLRAKIPTTGNIVMASSAVGYSFSAMSFKIRGFI